VFFSGWKSPIGSHHTVAGWNARIALESIHQSLDLVVEVEEPPEPPAKRRIVEIPEPDEVVAERGRQQLLMNAS